MKHKLFFALFAGVIAASSILGSNVASAQEDPAQGPLPGSLICKVGKGQEECIKTYLTSCTSGGGYASSTNDKDGNELMTCERR